LRITLWISIAH